jgi:DNA-binding GntR family transcriptional regulator
MDKISVPSLADLARDKIRDAILHGAIKPDEWLTIEKMATQLGISRTPVREALKTLEADGLVRIFPNRGAVVCRFDAQDLKNRYALRALLEGHAGEAACAAEGAALADRLDGICSSMAARLRKLKVPRDADLVELIELNGEFHRAIVRASGNGLLQKFLDMLQTPLVHRFYQWRDPARQQAVMDDHAAIVKALRLRQPALVKSLLEKHVLEACEFLLKSLQHTAPVAPQVPPTQKHGMADVK